VNQSAPGETGSTPIVNAMTVDVEDYFQVSAFDDVIARDQWDAMESRVCANTERLLGVLDDYGVRGTFFVLGWVAARHPRLVTSIAARGHELASHGFAHQLVYTQTPAAFREDIRRAKAVIEDAGGARVTGYRAPSFSITSRSLWALDILAEEGYEYDASIFPIRHDRYGIPSSPRHPYSVERGSLRLTEVPGSTVRVWGWNLPVGGGGYFRIFPYAWTRWGIKHLNVRESQPAIFYLHPWEIDPQQPRLAVSGLSRFRHYRNLAKTERRLRLLLADFEFAPLASLLRRPLPSASPLATIPVAVGEGA
jgi:polysaccharide deacetylase family protein (PEP-CTERM system associated)